MEKKLMKNNQGITLVALVITIVVLLILAVITFQYATKDKGVNAKAHETSFKARWIGYKEQVDTYTTWEMAKNMNIDISKIHAGEVLEKLIEQGIITDISKEEVNTSLDKIIGKINEKDKNYLMVYHGELCYIKDNNNENAEQEAKWSIDLQIPVVILK